MQEPSSEDCETPGFLLQIEQLISSEAPSQSSGRCSPVDSTGSTLPTPSATAVRVLNEFESYNDFCGSRSSSFFVDRMLPSGLSPASILSPSLGETARSCPVCSGFKDSVLIPCGHKFGCYVCSEKLRICPCCQETVKRVLRVGGDGDVWTKPFSFSANAPVFPTPSYHPQYISSYDHSPPYCFSYTSNFHYPQPVSQPVSQPPSPSYSSSSSDRANADASAFIKEQGKIGGVGNCWTIWNRLTSEGHTPNEITLGCMVDALVSNRQVFSAEQLVRQWKERVPPNTVVYSTLIHGWAKVNDAKKAQGIFSLMRHEGVPCNAVTYNCVIHACVRVGDMEGAINLLHSMRGGSHENGCILKPDKFTYSTIIKGYCGKGEIEQALSLFDGMLKEGLSPDLVIYNTLLDGCVKRRHHEVCDKLLFEMTQSWNIHPNSYTLSILIKRYGRQGDLIRAFELVEDLPKRYGFQANAHVWTCLISACITQGKMSVAEIVFSAMCGIRLEPIADDHRFISAVGESLASICAPDAKTFETLIQGALRFNLPSKALALAIECSQRFERARLPQSCIEQVIQVSVNAGFDISDLLRATRCSFD